MWVLQCNILAAYWCLLHSSRHCQFSVPFDHSQATRCSVTEECLSSGWAALDVCHAAGGRRHCQDSEGLSASSSCHLQEAGRSPLHCQVTPLSAVCKDSCRQCQHQLLVAFPDASSQSQRYCFRQLLTFFQSLFLRTEGSDSATLFSLGCSGLTSSTSPTPSSSCRR